MASLLRIEQLTYALSYRSILQSLSLTVAAGEIVLVTGAAGVGKTLLLRLLNRLTPATSGQIYLADRESRSLPVPQWRRQVSLVGVEPNLLGMSVQAALLYPLQLQKLTAGQAEQRLIGLLEQWPIPEAWLPLTATQLSIAQQQVVAVARSLVLQPPVLLLDEPMKYLEAPWLERILAIARCQNMAVLATGQGWDVDRVLCLQAGQIAWERSTVNWDELSAEFQQAEADDW